MIKLLGISGSRVITGQKIGKRDKWQIAAEKSISYMGDSLCQP